MPTQVSPPLRMVARTAGDVRIHTFVSSFTGNNIANATHIVESRNTLVLIDGQFLVPYAKAFREYADSLGKPIDRLYLSHRHPDHWFGLGAAFDDVPVHALSETASFIQEHGEDSLSDHWKLGDLAPEHIVVPKEIAEPGATVVDGVTYHLGRVTETEVDFHLTVSLPELGVCFAQDLLYSGTHLYLTRDMAHWSTVLEELLTSDYDLFMPGHGLPADKIEVARNVEYLAAARQAIADGLTGDAFKDFLLRRYPERRCPGIFDIYLPRLFGDSRDY
ncbi:glyoxylase-like metal-dependent hydrolase (beta-lactamase superfamily II) [Catenuloplanes nepalensis]|uniref:Glyoxylase-like metal-dependent hydrolase (Beta-lactamase superfamily II) n=1 Tax=Catenuloplanes nepalensis TaxID=587533 RepID=A0ABT9MQQ6_9ACTN|nr:MBL fold metallo-hydrolase [Catenuloplanes nepalensis]MDP9793763.1 glyoxylase-like metal-dependent hydrolase (beta-lactamase superfamily II) [Catenuloplanes nepalensis]